MGYKALKKKQSEIKKVAENIVTLNSILSGAEVKTAKAVAVFSGGELKVKHTAALVNATIKVDVNLSAAKIARSVATTKIHGTDRQVTVTGDSKNGFKGTTSTP